MRTDSREMLALGMFGRGSRLGERIALLLRRGRAFSPRVSRARMVASAAALLACFATGSLAPKWIALAQEPLRFEVASVKPTPPNGPGYRLNCEAGRRFDTLGTNVQSLVIFAYDASGFQVSGGPAWVNSRDSGFDIEARPPAPMSLDQCRRMVQTLLAERFKVVVHREAKEMPVYALVVGSKGSKLHEAGPDEPTGMHSNIMLNGIVIGVNDNYRPTATSRGMTMAQLAGFLQGEASVGRPVLDQTNLKGVYSLTLDYAERPANDDRPDLFTAVQEQLGLKLESTRAPVDMLVIDHAEKPDAN